MTSTAETSRPRIDLIMESARDSLNVRRVFGDPIVQGDVTVVPVARVYGGSGMGFGSGSLDARGGERGSEDSLPDAGGPGGGGAGDGGGGGFGVAVRPLGVFVVRGDDVEWQPAIDLTRVIIGGQIVGAVAILVITRALRRRRPGLTLPLPPLPLVALPRLGRSRRARD